MDKFVKNWEADLGKIDEDQVAYVKVEGGRVKVEVGRIKTWEDVTTECSVKLKKSSCSPDGSYIALTHKGKTVACFGVGGDSGASVREEYCVEKGTCSRISFRVYKKC